MFRMQIACIVMVLFMAVIYCRVKRRRTYSHILFMSLMLMTIENLIFDIITVYTVNALDRIPIFWNNVFHKIFICSLAGSLFLTFCYSMSLISTDMRKKDKPQIFWFIPLILSLIGICVLPIEYIETPKGNYSSGPAAYMAYVCVSFYLLISFVYLIRFWNAINSKKRSVITLALLTELVVSIFQALNPTALITGLGVTVLNLSFFLTVESPDVHLIERLEEETEQANEANAAKSAFIANMSHEIRTPLGAVLGMNEMILRESSEPQVRQYAVMAKGAAQTLHGIIDDVLDFSKIESGKMEIIPVEYDICSMLSDLYYMISVRTKDKGLVLNIHVNSELPSRLWGDDMRIRQILTNLLTNAVKYTPKGSVTLNVTGQITEDEVMFHYEVRDTGIGIKQEDLQLLFVAFERIEESRNRHIEGTGLGVNITMQLLELMGSTLKVSSEYGVGSCFSFDLKQKIMSHVPVGDFEKKLNTITPEQNYHASFYAPKARILMVDDNEMNRIVFAGLLKKTGVRIDEASDGFECLKKVEEQYYDLIFMDHMMPNMDGIETFERLRAMKDCPSHDTPVIILTANAVNGAKERYRDKGFDDFLAKPIVPKKLELMIQKHLPQEMQQEKAEETIVRLPVEATIPQVYENMEEEELPIINGINWELAQIHFTNRELMMQMIKQFLVMIEPESLAISDDLAKALDSRITDDYRTRVHAMKSSAALIGAIPISGISRILEEAAKEDNYERMANLTPILLEELVKMKPRLQEFLGVEIKQEITDWDIVNKQLEELFLACEGMDMTAIDDCYAQLQNYHFPENMEVQMKELGNAILYLETEKAQEIIRGIQEQM